MELLAVLLFVVICFLLLSGYPVALVLAGTSLLFAFIGNFLGTFDLVLLSALPNRLFGLINNQTLLAVPLFVFMGTMLERAKIAEELINAMADLFQRVPAGLGISVTLVGMLLAASTGIVGATVVTMGLMSLPTMLKRGYGPSFSSGIICATGTLGQIIPPSIALVLLGDVLSSAYQRAQLSMGIFSPKAVSVGDLFAGAVVPGLLLVALYIGYCLLVAWLNPQMVANHQNDAPNGDRQSFSSVKLKALLNSLLPPLLLILAVLGSILLGFATPTEAAGVGAMGAMVLSLFKRQLTWLNLQVVMETTVKITSMVFLILIGASLFSLVFRGFGGEAMIQQFFEALPGGKLSAMLLVMIAIFLLGFILDFIEITFVVVPIVAPILLMMGFDPIWLGIMIAVNLQTSFLTPPFGFSLFYLRGVAASSIKTSDMYRGVTPFILIQLILLAAMAMWPNLVTWLPAIVYGNG